jgi:hypothetical protein
MINKYMLINGEIEVGDTVLYGVFYGIVKGFNKDHTLATVDFSNGDNEPTLILMKKISQLKRCGDEVKPCSRIYQQM